MNKLNINEPARTTPGISTRKIEANLRQNAKKLNKIAQLVNPKQVVETQSKPPIQVSGVQKDQLKDRLKPLFWPQFEVIMNIMDLLLKAKESSDVSLLNDLLTNKDFNLRNTIMELYINIAQLEQINPMLLYKIEHEEGLLAKESDVDATTGNLIWNKKTSTKASASLTFLEDTLTFIEKQTCNTNGFKLKEKTKTYILKQTQEKSKQLAIQVMNMHNLGKQVKRFSEKPPIEKPDLLTLFKKRLQDLWFEKKIKMLNQLIQLFLSTLKKVQKKSTPLIIKPKKLSYNDREECEKELEKILNQEKVQNQTQVLPNWFDYNKKLTRKLKKIEKEINSLKEEFSTFNHYSYDSQLNYILRLAKRLKALKQNNRIYPYHCAKIQDLSWSLINLNSSQKAIGTATLRKKLGNVIINAAVSLLEFDKLKLKELESIKEICSLNTNPNNEFGRVPLKKVGVDSDNTVNDLSEALTHEIAQRQRIMADLAVVEWNNRFDYWEILPINHATQAAFKTAHKMYTQQYEQYPWLNYDLKKFRPALLTKLNQFNEYQKKSIQPKSTKKAPLYKVEIIKSTLNSAVSAVTTWAKQLL